MTTTWRHRNRDTPHIDEQAHAEALARYLRHQLHPCIAVILAYEDATTRTHQKTSSGAHNETTPNTRTHIQPREPHLPT